MRDLEHIIKENRLAFDSYEPGEQHMTRFSKKLSAFRHRSISTIEYFKIAAVAVLASLFSFFLYNQLQTILIRDKGYSLSDVSEEYREVEQYYTRMINYRYLELEKIDTGDPYNKIMLIKELSDMDQLYKNLQQDLKANPGDERIINAMIRHYQMKLDIMNQILTQLECLNHNINSSNHENKDI